MNTTGDHTSITTPPAGQYAIDAGTSTVAFHTRHFFGLAPVRGTFAIRSGTVNVVEPLADSGVEVEIDAASFHSTSAARDRVVRSARFLDAERHPFITFTSTDVADTTVTGELTAHGVTRPVTLAVESCAQGAEGFTVRATTRVDRTEFGITGSRGMTGRYLQLVLDVTCRRS